MNMCDHQFAGKTLKFDQDLRNEEQMFVHYFLVSHVC